MTDHLRYERLDRIRFRTTEEEGRKNQRTSISRYYDAIVRLRVACLDITLEERTDIVLDHIVHRAYGRITSQV